MAVNLVMEEREECMVSPTGGRACKRAAHFLRPSVTSIDGNVAAPPPDTSTSPLKYEDLSVKAIFLGWKIPQEKWKTWVDRMHSSHHSTWKKAGIFDAVMSSKCNIRRHQDLIFNFVDKWCPATNTMVFPWGEATITLEDAAVLGGFSVLGESVLAPTPADEESQQIVKKLLAARSDINNSPAKKADQNRWIAKFMGGGSEIEHEAFLAYWLSRFVFPFSRGTIVRDVLPIAVRLARGIKIALAPAVLADIYRSLSLLKASIVAVRKESQSQSENGVLEITVSAPLALLQVWIWERFPSLRPNPISIGQNEPRLARWNDSKKSNIHNMKIDYAGEEFMWRPYTTGGGNAVSRMVYKDKEYWATVGEDLDEHLEGLVRCLRASELISLQEDCIEHYLPHRVAMQFGMDQDLPGHVPRVNVNSEIAWRDYTRPIGDAKIYVPSRLFEANVTSGYFKWWKKMNLGWRNITETDVDETKDFIGKISEDDSVLPPPGFLPKLKRVSKSGIFERFRDRENGEFVDGRSPFSSSAYNEKGSCGKASKRKLAESSSGYGVGVSTRSRDDDPGGICGLENRVRIIEKLCALLKSGKIGLPLMKKSRM